MPKSVWTVGRDPNALFKSGQVVAYFSGVWQVADFADEHHELRLGERCRPPPSRPTPRTSTSAATSSRSTTADTAAPRRRSSSTSCSSRTNYTKLASTNGFLPVETGSTSTTRSPSRPRWTRSRCTTKEIEAADPISSSGANEAEVALDGQGRSATDPTKDEIGKLINGQQVGAEDRSTRSRSLRTSRSPDAAGCAVPAASAGRAPCATHYPQGGAMAHRTSNEEDHREHRTAAGDVPTARPTRCRRRPGPRRRGRRRSGVSYPSSRRSLFVASTSSSSCSSSSGPPSSAWATRSPATPASGDPKFIGLDELQRALRATPPSTRRWRAPCSTRSSPSRSTSCCRCRWPSCSRARTPKGRTRRPHRVLRAVADLADRRRRHLAVDLRRELRAGELRHRAPSAARPCRGSRTPTCRCSSSSSPTAWTGTAFNMLLFVAAHQERAAVVLRGRRRSTAPARWHQFRYITLPSIAPTSFIVVLLSHARGA